MQLRRRDKVVVLGGIGGLALLMVIQFGVRPALGQISTLRRVVRDKHEILAQMQAKTLEYRMLQAEVGRLGSTIAGQQEGRRILSTVEGIRKASGLPDNVLSLKPSTAPINAEYQQTIVEIRMEGVTLAQLITFLAQLDSLNLVGGVRSLDIRTAERSAGLLRAVIQLTTLMSVDLVRPGV